MKKIIAFILAISLIILLSACGSGNATTTTPVPPSSSTSQQSDKSTEPQAELSESAEAEDTVVDGWESGGFYDQCIEYLYDNFDDLSHFGYSFADINQDGLFEIIAGPFGSPWLILTYADGKLNVFDPEYMTSDPASFDLFLYEATNQLIKEERGTTSGTAGNLEYTFFDWTANGYYETYNIYQNNVVSFKDGEPLINENGDYIFDFDNGFFGINGADVSYSEYEPELSRVLEAVANSKSVSDGSSSFDTIDDLVMALHDLNVN